MDLYFSGNYYWQSFQFHVTRGQHLVCCWLQARTFLAQCVSIVGSMSDSLQLINMSVTTLLATKGTFGECLCPNTMYVIYPTCFPVCVGRFLHQGRPKFTAAPPSSSQPPPTEVISFKAQCNVKLWGGYAAPLMCFPYITSMCPALPCHKQHAAIRPLQHPNRIFKK